MGTPGGYRHQTLGAFLSAVAERSPAPGGGGAAAVTVALAAGLVAMTAAHADDASGELGDRARRLQDHALDLADEDAAAYREVVEARSSGDQQRERAAWQWAIAVPLEIAECGARTATDAASVAQRCRDPLRGDAVTAVVLAEAGVRAAVRLVQLNVASTTGEDAGLARARRLADAAGAQLDRVSGEGDPLPRPPARCH